MKFSIALYFLTVLSLSVADELTDCKCWTDYEPHNGTEGISCYGIKLLHMMACNVPEIPKCQCSGVVTGIVSDSTGTWCAQYSEQKEEKRWACENKEEWDKFYKQNPNEKS